MIHRLAAVLAASLVLTSCDAVGDAIDAIDPAPDLNLRIVNTTAPVPVGDHSLVTLVASNDGEVEATDVLIAVVLPDNIESFDRPTGASGCLTGFGQCGAGAEMLVGLGAMSPGESRMLSFPLRPRAPGVYTVTGTLNASDADGTSASAQVRVGIAGQTFSAALTSPEGAVEPGAEVTLFAAWTNGTAGPADDAELDLTLPSGYTIASAEGGGAIDGRRVRWDLGTVDAGESGEFAVGVVVPETADFGDVDVAELTASSDAGASGTARRALTIAPATHLALSISADATSIPADGQTTVTLRVTNRGTRAEDVGARIVLPAGIESFMRPAGAGGCLSGFGQCGSGAELLWRSDGLAPGQSRTLSFPIRPDADAQGPLVLGGWVQTVNDSPTSSTTASLAITVDR